MSALKKTKSSQLDWQKYDDSPFGVMFSPNDLIKLIRYDITHGLHHYFNCCDVLYTEVAWKKGIERFNEYANQHVKYDDYVQAIAGVFKSESRPMFIVGGKDLGALLSPCKITRGVLNGDKVYVYHNGSHVMEEGSDTINLLYRLSKEYQCIGDFCCGLGRSGKVFYKNNKKAVLADYNGKCISYLNDNWNRLYGN